MSSTAAPARRWADNPYAIAEMALGEPIDWDKLDARGQRRALLAEIFQLRDADALFRGAPERNPVPTVLHLFRRVKYAAAGYASVEQALDDARRQFPREVTQLLDAFLRHPGAEERLRRIVPWLAPIRDDADTDAPGAPQPGRQPPRRVTWSDTAPGGAPHRLIEGSADFRDPMQGCIPDCALLASISALAWVDGDGWQQRLEDAARGQEDAFTFRFFGPARGTVEVSDKLPFEGRVLPYARSRSRAESWPTLYEKAYVKKSFDVSDEPTAQHYDAVVRESPHEVCMKLAPCRAGYAVSSPAFSHLKAHCTRLRDVGGGIRSSVARHPLTAWTLNDDELSLLGEDVATLSDDSLLAAGHAYTVLGWLRSAAGDWIVLRNPWGLKATHDEWLSGPWMTGRPETGLDRIELNRHGVIGIPVDVFNRFFDGVAWAVPMSG